jgi:hypothetical protein
MREYRFTESYQVGDTIKHRTFGVGVVEELTGPGKMQVFFADGRRVMAHEQRPAG